MVSKTRKTKDVSTIGIVAGPALDIKSRFDGYGGTERVIPLLADGLVEKGYKVVLFAPDGSDTKADHVPTGRALWTYKNYNATRKDFEQAMERTFSTVRSYYNSNNLDVIHFHVDNSLADPRFRSMPTVNTLHGDPIACGEILKDNYLRSEGKPVVFISNTQRDRMQYVAKDSSYVVYNAINMKEFSPSYDPGKYLVYLGRISEEKGLAVALDVAHVTHSKIVVLAREPDKVAVNDQYYYKSEIKPRLRLYGDEVKLELDRPRDEIARYLRGSFALIGPSGYPPSKWAEPFGLFIVEANASGTPAIVYNKGGPAELVVEGKNGYKCDTISEMVRAVDKIKNTSGHFSGVSLRLNSRVMAEQRFNPEKMVDDYLKVYRDVSKDRLRKKETAVKV